VLKVILDTNIYVSALLARHGIPGRIYRAWQDRRFLVVTSSEQLGELVQTLAYPRIRRRYPITDTVVDDLLSLLKSEALLVPVVTAVEAEQLRDPKDQFLLTMAIESGADILVSGDQDLLVLERFSATQILTPRSFLDLLDSMSQVESSPPITQVEEMGGEAPCQLPRFWDAD
jgi:hypothetical protein